VKYEFRLRFPLSEVMFWAARYVYADDAEVEAIGKAARERGWFTRDEFLTVARWKSPRSRRLCEENDESAVKAVTQLALSTPDERQRIETLTHLRGIGFPTASVLLHLGHRDPYPIIDFRALWSLGVQSPPAAYSFTFWWAYTQACRSLAREAGVRMRTLDRALWQYSKERQGPSSNKVAAQPAETGSATPEPGHMGHGAAATSGVPGPRTPKGGHACREAARTRTERTSMPGSSRPPSTARRSHIPGLGPAAGWSAVTSTASPRKKRLRSGLP
jgi:hypothetical protein